MAHAAARCACSSWSEPRTRWGHALLTLAALVALGGCSSPRRGTSSLALREVTPAFLDSVAAEDAAIAADAHGRVALTWVARTPDGAPHLWIAVSSDSATTFHAPQRLDDGATTVPNGLELGPTAVFGAAGALVVAWSAPRAGSPDVQARASGDGGMTFGEISFPAGDPPAGGHARGRAALAFRTDGACLATWLDGLAARAASDTARVAIEHAISIDGGQSWHPRQQLRGAVGAYHPAVAAGPRGEIAIAYRGGRSGAEPALAVSYDGGDTFAGDTTLAPGDGGGAAGDEGPALLWSHADGGFCAWRGARGVTLLPWRTPGVAAGVSRAAGDSLDAAGHPRLVAWGDALLIGVVARPRADSTRRVFAVRALEPSGDWSPWWFLGAHARDGGLAGAGGASAYACWIEADSTRAGRMRVVRLTRP